MADFIGTAVGAIQPNGRGGLLLVSGDEAIERSITYIIETLLGSHLLEPWLGVKSFVFQPMPSLYAAAEVIKDAIIDGDDRVEPSTLVVEAGIADGGKLDVAVSWSRRGEASVRTLERSFRALLSA